jgi:hypothetical protein
MLFLIALQFSPFEAAGYGGFFVFHPRRRPRSPGFGRAGVAARAPSPQRECT